MSESSTPYGSPCATPTRADQPEAPVTPVFMATPPRHRVEEMNTEAQPSTPTPTLTTPVEVRLAKVSTFDVCWRMVLTDAVLVLQTESSVENSPEICRKPSVQEVSPVMGEDGYFCICLVLKNSDFNMTLSSFRRLIVLLRWFPLPVSG